MTKRCFLVVGPEGSGNRLLTGILVRAGCHGAATAHHAWRLNEALPTDETPVAVIRSFPHGGEWPDLPVILATLRHSGFLVTVLVTCRDWSAGRPGRMERGHLGDDATQQAAYRRIFAGLGTTPFRLVSYESLVLHPERAVAHLLADIGLSAERAGDIVVEGRAGQIIDHNAVRYGVAIAPTTAVVRALLPGLIWSPERAIGYYPVHGGPAYDEAYFAKYQSYADTPMGRALTRSRVNFVAKHWHGPVTDIGIGSGQFVETRGETTTGFDVNPAGIAWLRGRGLFHDPYAEPVAAATFWDSFEHIADPAALLARVNHAVFLSLPVFDGPDHALRSKHFRPTEHYWYFTRAGLVRYMHEAGFHLAEHATFETSLGREDIESFAFRRDR